MGNAIRSMRDRASRPRQSHARAGVAIRRMRTVASALTVAAATAAAIAYAADTQLAAPSLRLQPAPPLDQQVAALQQQVQALQQQVQAQQQQMQAQQQQFAALQAVLSVLPDGTAVLRAPNVRIETTGNDLTLRANQHMRIESGLDLSLRGGTDVALQASTTASIRGSSTNIDGMGQLALHGPTIQMNNGAQPAIIQMNNGSRPVATIGSPVVNNVVQAGSTSVLVN